MDHRQELTEARSRLLTAVDAWASTQGVTVKTAAVLSDYHRIFLAVGSPTFKGRSAGDVHDDLWDYLAAHNPRDVVKISRLYVLDDVDFDEEDLQELVLTARSA